MGGAAPAAPSLCTMTDHPLSTGRSPPRPEHRRGGVRSDVERGRCRVHPLGEASGVGTTKPEGYVARGSQSPRGEAPRARGANPFGDNGSVSQSPHGEARRAGWPSWPATPPPSSQSPLGEAPRAGLLRPFAPLTSRLNRLSAKPRAQDDSRWAVGDLMSQSPLGEAPRAGASWTTPTRTRCLNRLPAKPRAQGRRGARRPALTVSIASRRSPARRLDHLPGHGRARVSIASRRSPARRR